MTGATPRVSYDQLVAALRDLCAGGSTGTLFMVTDENHAMRLGLDGGDIVTLVAGDICDEAAIPALRAIKSASYRFKMGLLIDTPAADKPLDTESLLATLAGEKTAPRQTSPPQGDTLMQVRGIVESEALDVIGPIARVLCAEHCAEVQDLRSLKKALERIAVEIHDADRAQELRSRVMDRVRKTLPALQ